MSDEYNNTFVSFINQFKNDKHHQSTDEKIMTHYSLYNPKASFNIPYEKKEELFEILNNHIFVEKLPAHLIESRNEISNIKIDLDFKFNVDDNKRKYTIDTIKDIVEIYHTTIKKYIDIDESKINAYVFERSSPYISRGNCKDGIHIIYPDIITTPEVQLLIRDDVIKKAENILTSLKCKNVINDIIDKSIITTNGWLLYGCSKPSAKPYLLTHIFDSDLSDKNIKNIKTIDIMRKTSIRDHLNEELSNIREEFVEKLNQYKINTPTATLTNKISAHFSKKTHKTSSENIDEIKQLVEILSSERAESYKDWIDVGLCLHNIDTSLLSDWVNFSKKSSKFVDGECEMKWCDIDQRDDGLGIGSLHRWAKMDNPEEYKRITRNGLESLIIKSRCKTTQDIAKVIYYLFKYQYKCTDTKRDEWYEFRNHRWYKNESGVSIFTKIGNEVVNEYLNVIKRLVELSIHEQDEAIQSKYLEQSKELTEITYKLRDYSFKHKLKGECQAMFYDDKFYEKLNANPHLLCFENGVYDLAEFTFRDGRPEDYITFSTGYDYEEINDDDVRLTNISDMFEKIFPNVEKREYVYKLLATMLEGINPREKFYIWTGTGANGKSKIIELFEMALGDYATKIPITTFTQKRGSASSATPELARLPGVRFVDTQEPDDGDKFNVGILKEYSGNDELYGRELFKSPITFKPQFKIVLCCNQLPKISADDEGTWRRIVVIEFDSEFVYNPDPNKPNQFKRDDTLSYMFPFWKSALIYMLINHFKQFKQSKCDLIEPKCVVAYTQQYRDKSNILNEFYDEFIKKEKGYILKIDETYKFFKTWWYGNCDGKVPSRTELKNKLEKKIGSSYKNGWKGYKLHSFDENDEQDDEINDIITISEAV